MLSWSVVSQGQARYSKLADFIQITLFAVTKSPEEDRLISWPRIQNHLLSDPPHTHLPSPDLFQSIMVKSPSLSAFNFDVANMFHNIALLQCISMLFPLPKVKLSDLPPPLVTFLHNLYPGKLRPKTILRPCQAFMPIEFKWSVFVSHTFASKLLQESFHMLEPLSPARPASDGLLSISERPFSLVPNRRSAPAYHSQHCRCG